MPTSVFVCAATILLIYEYKLYIFLNFRPSIHQGFSANEKYEETIYRLAENQGFMGENCQQLYPQCIDSLFNFLTITDFMNI